ncbi:MAG: UMP kinase [Nanoarchaeota archaeon]
MKEIVVMSLGGSLIVPEHIDTAWIDKFKEIIINLTKKYKFIIVCGGGFVAREYITILEKEHKSKKQQSLAGIQVTRMNAKIMTQIFGKIANKEIPLEMKHVKSMLQKNDVVFCGALRYAPNQTSDSTAAKLAQYLKLRFINLTNVDGLYTSNPTKHKDAKFIEKISWAEFEKCALEIKYKPGQHFVLDQKAATVIKKHKITTYILGKNLNNLKNMLNNKKFKGTTITE